MNRGSSGYRARAPVGRRRFNEAPIHESGKSRRLGERREHASAASMRPRFMNRGSGERGAHSVRSDGGFNEAPIHESGKCRGRAGAVC